MTEIASTPAPAPTTTSTLLGKHHDITSFTGKNPFRLVLQTVHYNSKVKCLEATDGSICIRVPVVEDNAADFPPVSVNGEARDCMIPVAPFRRALANVPKCNVPIAEHMRLSVSQKGAIQQVHMVTTDLETEQSVSVPAAEGNYPDIAAILPTGTPVLQIILASVVLKRLVDYAERFGKESNNVVPITLEFMSEEDGHKVQFSVPLDTARGDKTCATGVLMPLTLK